MGARALRLPCIILLLALAACSSKPADTASNGAQNTAAPASDAGGSGMSSQPAPAPQAVVVPSGTTLRIRLGESLGSKISSPGQSFSATLASDVVVDGNAVIPKRTSVRGTVVDAKPLGKFKGGAVLEIKLSSITIDGATVPVETSAVMRELKGKGKRTAVMAGGGTALGAIVGGLAGGGKGAAIGAAAGAGAGAGGAAFTGNKEIVLPAETVLSFRLRAPLEIRTAK